MHSRQPNVRSVAGFVRQRGPGGLGADRQGAPSRLIGGPGGRLGISGSIGIVYHRPSRAPTVVACAPARLSSGAVCLIQVLVVEIGRMLRSCIDPHVLASCLALQSLKHKVRSSLVGLR